jgi:hypothetical protein
MMQSIKQCKAEVAHAQVEVLDGGHYLFRVRRNQTGIDGRPMSEYIFVKRGGSSANTRSVIARIVRSGWSARTL